MTIKIRLLTTPEMNSVAEFFHGGQAAQLIENYYSFIYTGLTQYRDTGDKNILQSLLTAASIMTKSRVTTKMVAIVCAHKMLSNGKIGSRIDKNKMAKTKGMDDSVILDKLVSILDGYEAAKKAKQEKEFDKDKALIALGKTVVKLLENGVAIHDIQLVLSSTDDQQLAA